MTTKTKFLAGLLLAGAVFAGARATATAGDKGIIDFHYMGNDGETAFLTVLAGSDLEGMPVDIRFGDAPYQGMPLGASVLHAGPNIVAVPYPHLGGWYTAVTPIGYVRTFDDSDQGWN